MRFVAPVRAGSRIRARFVLSGAEDQGARLSALLSVTVEIEGDKLLVHGLYESGTEPEGFIEMHKRCAAACDPKEAR